MKKRKLIGIIVSEIEGLYQTKLLKGIISQAYKLDYDVAVFATFIKNSGLKSYQTGEVNIFNLINFDLLDGLIYAPQSVALEEIAIDLEQLLRKECRVPIVSVDDFENKFPAVVTDDRKTFEKVIEHLAVFHNYKNIYLLNAPENTKEAAKREKSYKKVLEKSGLEYKQENVFYGDNTYVSGEKLARKIIDGKIVLPDAIACANDFCALGLCNVLIENGYKIPQDLAITGYDCSAESFYNPISLTTASAPIFATGVEAVNELYWMITRQDAPTFEYDDNMLTIAHSCGCDISADYLRKSDKFVGGYSGSMINMYEYSYMAERLTETKDYDSCIKKLCSYTYLIQDHKEFYLCLCQEDESGEPEKYITQGYGKNMTLAIKEIDGESVAVSESFPVSQLIPTLFNDRDYPTTFYFTPLHFDDRCLGYTVLNYGRKICVPDKIYRNWIRNTNNALEMSRVQAQLKLANEKLFMASTRDGLTGLYNRRGYQENIAISIKQAIDRQTHLLVMLVDCDLLKYINDTFGHQEGDCAIKAVAYSLSSACLNDEFCARIGGDEFLIFGSGCYTDEIIREYENRIHESLVKFNEKSDKPYTVDASVGAVYEFIDDCIDVDELIEIADKRMYEKKTLKKKNRRC